MSKVALWVKLDIKPGMREEAKAIIQEAIDAVEAEEGTLLYLLHEDPNDETVLYFYDAYSSPEALGAHSGSDWFKAYSPKLGTVLAGRPAMTMVTLVGGKGV